MVSKPLSPFDKHLWIDVWYYIDTVHAPLDIYRYGHRDVYTAIHEWAITNDTPRKESCGFLSPLFWPILFFGDAEPLTIMIIKAFNSLWRKVPSSEPSNGCFFWELPFCFFGGVWGGFGQRNRNQLTKKNPGWIWCLGRNFSSWSSPFTAHGSLGVRVQKPRFSGR